MTGSVLSINGGSSSIKFVLYAPGDSARTLVSGKVERIGLGDALFRVRVGDEKPTCRSIEAADHEQALSGVIEELDKFPDFQKMSAIGHRLVHGGMYNKEPRLITQDLLDELQRIRPLDPDHLPAEIALIEAFARRFPALPQVACFDTAFHHDMPRVAQLLAVPRRYQPQGLRRYGFHGLSYAYLMEELRRIAGPTVAQGRIVLAHLGAGASMAAMRDGKCMDTSMGFTPAAGLVMGTRCGDLDPGVLIYLMRSERLNADQLDDLINRQSGLVGLSETSSDMRELLESEASDSRAADAVALFCYQAKKWLGAFAAALGGLDTLVFAGGIGESSPQIRARICNGVEFLDLHLDAAANAANGTKISTAHSKVGVWVIPTDEELMIARSVRCVLGPFAN